jgi:hypothetical protein
MSTFYDGLITAGVNPVQALTLDGLYANLNIGEFLEGLEAVAYWLTNKKPGPTVTTCEPWIDILAAMGAGQDPEAEYLKAIGTLPPHAGMAVADAVLIRQNAMWAYQASLKPLAGKKRSTAEYVLLLSSLGFKFKYNAARSCYECNGSRLTDDTAMLIRAKLADAGVDQLIRAEEAYKADAFENHAYHPIKDYLQDLVWDGDDHITDLSDKFQDERSVFPIFLKRWLIGAVARVMGGYQNRVLVLDGPQGIGKSQFVNWLASPNPEYWHEGAVNPEDKDTYLRLIGTWIWEVNEFGVTTKKDVEQLKAFFTTYKVRVRKAYAQYDTEGVAMCSFIGTANNQAGLLSDPTGSRRFMVTKLTGIDWSYSALDVDQVWAQAYALYLLGEPYDLTPGEKKLADEINEDYQIIDIVEETIKRWFEIDPAQTSWRMTTVEILTTLKDPGAGNLKPGAEIDARKLASALTKIGLGQPKVFKFPGTGSTMRGYAGIKLKP